MPLRRNTTQQSDGYRRPKRRTEMLNDAPCEMICSWSAHKKFCRPFATQSTQLHCPQRSPHKTRAAACCNMYSAVLLLLCTPSSHSPLLRQMRKSKHDAGAFTASDWFLPKQPHQVTHNLPFFAAQNLNVALVLLVEEVWLVSQPPQQPVC